jgi:hypothetical protein
VVLFLQAYPVLAEGDTASPPAAPAINADWLLTVQARQALLKDDRLAPLNLGVRVERRIATVSGAVPSADLARRAESRLRQVPGMAGVQNELHVLCPGDPLAEVLLQPVPQPAAPFGKPLVPGNFRPRAELTGRGEEHQPASVPGVLPQPGKRSAAAAALISTPPISIPHPPDPGPATIPSPGPVGLETAIERLRQGDMRLRMIRIEVQEGMVHLRGIGARAEDLMQLAGAVSRLPGVKRVVVEGPYTAP